MNTELDKHLNVSLLLIKDESQGSAFILATRNKKIAEFLNVPYDEKKLNSFDEHQKTNYSQFYNVITNKIESADPKLITFRHHIGIPMSFSPSFLVSESMDAADKNTAFEIYFENIKPLFQKIKEFKELGVDDFGQIPSLNHAVFNLNKKLADLNIIIPENNILHNANLVLQRPLAFQ
jgi:hypothetical protein